MVTLSSFILNNLNSQRKNGVFCDLKISIDNDYVWAHSSVLSSVSAYVLKRCQSLNLKDTKNEIVGSKEPLEINIANKGVNCFDCICNLLDIIYAQNVSLVKEHIHHVEDALNSLEFFDEVLQFFQNFLKVNSDGNTALKKENPKCEKGEDVKQTSPVQISKKLTNTGSNCRTVYNRRKALKNQKNLSSSKILACIECRHQCYKPQDMLCHILDTKHGKNVCSLCLHVSESPSQFDEHLKKHDKAKVFFCNTCDQRFQTRALWSQHVPVHSSTTPYKCPHCPKGFKWKHGLNSHLVTHTKERKHLCDECGYSTTLAKTLRAHMLTHTGDLFKCTYSGCSHTSLRKENMKIHLGTHSKQKPYVCEICGLKFTQNKNLQRHSLIHGTNPIGDNLCPHCPFRAIRSDNLKAHIARQHIEKEMNLELIEEFEDILDDSIQNNAEANCEELDIKYSGIDLVTNYLSVLANAASICPKIDEIFVKRADNKKNTVVLRNYDNLISNPDQIVQTENDADDKYISVDALESNEDA